MFDDQQSQNAVPGNLPLGEPEDMFAGTDPLSPHPGSMPVGLSDQQSAELPPVESSSPSALDAGRLRPAAQPITSEPSSAVPLPPPAPMHVSPMEQLSPEVVKGPSTAKFIMIVLLVLIGVGVLGGIGYMTYRIFFVQNSEPAASATSVDQPVTTEPSQEDISGPSSTDAAAIIDDSVLFGEPIDNDSDNLDNAREEVLGTDPNNWDTDGDGLGDGDEVIIWKTDPNNPDTDGDSYPDGSEVRNGYSPTGPGRIFEPPTPNSEGAMNASLSSASTSVGKIVDCGTDTECFLVAASGCDPARLRLVTTFDLRETYGVLQDVTYAMTLNGESSSGACNVDMSIAQIQLAFTDSVSEEQKQSQREASADREGKAMNCKISSTALIEAINKRHDTDVLVRVTQTGSCLGPLVDDLSQ